MRVEQETIHVLSAITRKLIRISDGILKKKRKQQEQNLVRSLACYLFHVLWFVSWFTQ